MGTQQVLLIVLAVIIVGIAVAVGITMFSTQSSSSNREALRADLIMLAGQVLAFYQTPASLAGGGNGNPGFGTSQYNYACNTWLGFPRNVSGGYSTSYRNDNGFFVTRFYGTVHQAQIYCMGRAKGQNPSYVNAYFWSVPESVRGNVSLALNIFADRNPPYTITVNN